MNHCRLVLMVMMFSVLRRLVKSRRGGVTVFSTSQTVALSKRVINVPSSLFQHFNFKKFMIIIIIIIKCYHIWTDVSTQQRQDWHDYQLKPVSEMSTCVFLKLQWGRNIWSQNRSHLPNLLDTTPQKPWITPFHRPQSLFIAIFYLHFILTVSTPGTRQAQDYKHNRTTSKISVKK